MNMLANRRRYENAPSSAKGSSSSDVAAAVAKRSDSFGSSTVLTYRSSSGWSSSSSSSHSHNSDSSSNDSAARRSRAARHRWPPPPPPPPPPPTTTSERSGKSSEKKREGAGGIRADAGDDGNESDVYDRFEEFGRKLDAEIQSLSRLGGSDDDDDDDDDSVGESERPRKPTAATDASSTSDETDTSDDSGAGGRAPSPSGLSSSSEAPPRFKRSDRRQGTQSAIHSDCNDVLSNCNGSDSSGGFDRSLETMTSLDTTLHSLDSDLSSSTAQTGLGSDRSSYSEAAVQAAVLAARQHKARKTKACRVQEMQIRQQPDFLDREGEGQRGRALCETPTMANGRKVQVQQSALLGQDFEGQRHVTGQPSVGAGQNNQIQETCLLGQEYEGQQQMLYGAPMMMRMMNGQKMQTQKTSSLGQEYEDPQDLLCEPPSMVNAGMDCEPPQMMSRTNVQMQQSSLVGQEFERQQYKLEPPTVGNNQNVQMHETSLLGQEYDGQQQMIRAAPMMRRMVNSQKMQKHNSPSLGQDYEYPQEMICEPPSMTKGALHSASERRLRRDLPNRPPAPREYEILIHPSSVEGTAAAAAWHLHGQTGGRRRAAAACDDESGTQQESYSAMNARAVANALNNRSDKKGDDGTASNVSMDSEEGITTLSAATDGGVASSGERNYDDAWSTGVAAAIVTGAASRHHRSFFLFPHGRRVLLPVLTGALAAALSFATLLSCRFMTILPEEDGDADEAAFQVGPWRYLSVNPSHSGGDVCLPYPSDVALDAAFVTARSTSALALGFGCALVLWTCTLTCIPTSSRGVNGLALCFVLNGIVQCLTAMFYGSENCNGGGGYFGGGECRPNQDLVFCIAAAMLYLASGWILFLSHRFSSGGGPNGGERSSVSNYEQSMEVYTWSSEAKSSDPSKGVLRTVEKCWTKIPNGSTLTATVFVEQRKDVSGSGSNIGGGGKTKTTYTIQTDILPP